MENPLGDKQRMNSADNAPKGGVQGAFLRAWSDLLRPLRSEFRLHLVEEGRGNGPSIAVIRYRKVSWWRMGVGGRGTGKG